MVEDSNELDCERRGDACVDFEQRIGGDVEGVWLDVPAHDGIRVGDTKPRVTSSCSAKANPESQRNIYARVKWRRLRMKQEGRIFRIYLQKNATAGKTTNNGGPLSLTYTDFKKETPDQ